MRPLAVLVAGLAFGLASCGGGGPKGPPRDQALELSMSAGRDAMSLERPGEAARDYGDAYRRAITRDDAGAIGNAGSDLVIALTASDRPEAALAQARRTRAELARRRAPAPFELDLAQAACLLRLDRPSEAAILAARAESAPGPDVAARAAFLSGLAAARLGDEAALASSLARLGQDGRISLTWQADRSELASRLRLAEGQPAAALPLAREAARSRQAALDYRGMRRALRLASTAAWRVGDPALATSLEAEADESEAPGVAMQHGGP